MDLNQLWNRFQEHMAYTDEEMEVFRSDPEKVKMVTQTPDFVKCKIIAEVIESHNCHAHHKVGDKFVMTAGGVIISEECPKRICMFALGPITNILPACYEIIFTQSDPAYERSKLVQCTDIGLDKGGWGKILMKVYIEKPSE